MASVKVLPKFNKKNAKGEVPLYLRIIKDRKTKFISLGHYIKETDWNEKEKKVKKSHPNSTRLNAFIAQKIAEANDVALELQTKAKSISSKNIKNSILGKAIPEFFQFANKYVDKLEKTGNHSGYKRSKTVITKLKEYLNNNTLYFDDINVAFLKEYEHYLQYELKNKANTIHGNFKVIRKLFNDAIREDLVPMDLSPFLRYKVKTTPTVKNYLTDEELGAIEKLELPKDINLNHHRNLYVFACYAGGIRISDLLCLQWLNYDGERLQGKIRKTGSIFNVKLPTKALEIIETYNREDKTQDDFIFPFLKKDGDYSTPKNLLNAISSCTAYANKNLKIIAMRAEIEKNISFHTSRHTWATRALRKGMRIEYVSKIMGHSSIKETQVYAKIVNEELDKAMDVFG